MNSLRGGDQAPVRDCQEVLCESSSRGVGIIEGGKGKRCEKLHTHLLTGNPGKGMEEKMVGGKNKFCGFDGF